jgi:hypothetical protein
VRAFGEKLFDTIEAEPERLTEVTALVRSELAISKLPGPSRRSRFKTATDLNDPNVMMSRDYWRRRRATHSAVGHGPDTG